MAPRILFTFIITVFLVFYNIVDTKSPPSDEAPIEIIDSRSYIKSKILKRKAGKAKLDNPEMYGLIQRKLRTRIGASGPEYRENYLVEELKKARGNKNDHNQRSELNFISRGPGNIAGRTRALVVDPRDETNSTWIAGSASGGIWKTTSAGKNWINISEDLTSLSTNTLAFSENNPDVIYAGTGEHFIDDTEGNGLWKSTDAGNSWTQIASPSQYSGFKNVARMAVDPKDENNLIVVTSNSSWSSLRDYAIWKSTDGGDNFTRTYTSFFGRIDDLNANPKNFNVLYAAIQGFGIIKSNDGGTTWFESSAQLPGVSRIEIDVSEVDTAVIWASADGGPSASGSTVFYSDDSGASYTPLNDEAGEINYLGGQGFYDNIITAHPYNANEAYIGGVNLFKISVVGEGGEYVRFDVRQLGTQGFLTFINGTDFESEARLQESELNSIEIRFGQGTQKAHRFTVGGQGAGVAFSDYEYQDFVEVPFVVWDTDNDKQLAVSFRDQNDDGEWNLIQNNTQGSPSTHSREYLFIHDTEYQEEANSELSVTGGTEFRLMYFIWPALQAGGEFDPDNLPESELRVDKFFGNELASASKVISDAYGSFNNLNNFSNSNFINQEGVHPDQHNIVIIKKNDADESFAFIATNDGGVYVTNESVDPGTQEGDFTYAGFGYITSQFYGADKAPGEDRYIGGMQDNSTWFTPLGTTADSAANYSFAIGGDGFESIWNNSNPTQLIGGSQFNNFARSLDNGKTWIRATDSITEGGPFISRLANSKRFPNRLFTVGPSGVWRSDDFGGKWRLSPIEGQWSFNNSADVEVSHADSSVIWAGGFLSEEQRIFVSQDGGLSFSAVSNYDQSELGFVSGIGTHSTDPGTAFLLFSFSGMPKVLKTTDFGETWDDISGFEGNQGVSDRGFPDVAIQSLLVFPNQTDRIWVGSEIGIIESLDGGASWNLLQCNLPPVYVHEFKIQDDQVVLATYGRGIWSVQVDGIEQDFILPPAVTNASQFLSGELFIDYYLPSIYDSTKIYIDGQEITALGTNEKGGSTYLAGLISESGEITIEVESYTGDIVLNSLPYTLSVYVPGPIVTQYNNDFSDIGRNEEFVGFGFRIGLEDGFQNEAIHSDHPHPNGVNYTFTLTSPYLLTEESTNAAQFKEVVIIEPGEEGSVFGDGEFWDFVVVEGSQDGQNWQALAPGYDSRSDADWQEAYESNSDITEDLFRNRRFELEETFEIGDTLLIRFRLNSDQFATGWGWAIDDLEIGDVSSGLFQVNVINEVAIFPNPVSSVLTFEGEKVNAETRVNIYDLQGRLVMNRVGENPIEVSSLPEGTYLINLSGNQLNETLKFVKI